MIQTILVAAALVAFMYSWRRKRAEDRDDREPSIAPSEPPAACECAPLADDEWIAAEADRIVLAAYMDWRIERTLEEGL